MTVRISRRLSGASQQSAQNGDAAKDVVDPHEIKYTDQMKPFDTVEHAQRDFSMRHAGEAGPRVAVCFDGSKMSERAFEVALKFVRPAGSQREFLHVLHVYNEGMKEALKITNHVETLGKRLKAQGTYRFVYLEKPPNCGVAECLMRLAEDLHLDILVVGAQGKSRDGRQSPSGQPVPTCMSTLARTLLRSASCSVCLVRPTGLALEERPKWVCPVDGTAGSQVAFASMLTYMVRKGDCAEAWHVAFDGPAPPAPPQPSSPEPKGSQRKVRPAKGASIMINAAAEAPAVKEDDPAEPLHPYLAVMEPLRASGHLRPTARLFRVPFPDDPAQAADPSTSEVVEVLAQRSLDYAVDFLVVPDDLFIVKPTYEVPAPAPVPAAVPATPATVPEGAEADAAGKGVRERRAGSATRRPASAQGKGVVTGRGRPSDAAATTEVAAPAAPVATRRRPAAEDWADGISPQAWQIVETSRVTVLLAKDPLRCELRRREHVMQLKGLRLMPSESSFPVPQGTAVSSLGDMERMAQEVVVQAGWARH